MQLKKLVDSKKDNIILVPTHKSYVDFILLSFIHYHYKIDIPLVCGDPALFNLAFISYLMKNSGNFRLSQNDVSSDLFRAVIDGYVTALL